MRTTTFLAICGFIGFGAVVLFQYLLFYFEIEIPYIDWVIFKVIEFAVFTPVIAVILTPFNHALRQWRKKHGRDIEAEEKYENQSGFISLNEQNKE